MRFTARCRECRDYSVTFDTPQGLADWVQGGHVNGHADHRRFSVYCDFKPLYERVEGRGVEFRVGDEFVFTTRLGNRNDVIALGPDGRAALFDRVTPLTHELTEGLRVLAEVIIIGDRYMIVRPIEILGPASLLDVGLAIPLVEP